MFSFRRLAILLALSLPVMSAVQAQSSSSSSSSVTPDEGQNLAQNQTQNQAGSDAQQTPEQNQGQISVQERIRLRRSQRRATAIHDAYDHRWESYMDTGYLRFKPGPSLQRLTYYAWETGLTRFSTERLGYTLIGRGYYGTAYVGPNFTNDTRYAISQYDVLGGPVYRFYLQPKFAISGRAMAGWAYGNFEGDTNGFKNVCPSGPGSCLLYPNGSSFGASVSVIGEFNVSPNVALKLAPEYFFNGFGSTIQASRGFSGGLVYRWGKQ
jgi:hypothetical protein